MAITASGVKLGECSIRKREIWLNILLGRHPSHEPVVHERL